MASYINSLSAAGARTVPLIFNNPNMTEELAKLDKINGVFYCGGDAEGPYWDFGREVFLKAVAMNDKGNYFPAWGTCLGFQYLCTYAATAGLDVLTEKAFDSNDDNYPLHFTVPANETRMFEDLGGLNFLLANFNLTYNHHHDGVTPDKFETDAGLKKMFKPTSVSYDNNGKIFIASMEGYNYPFYGV